MVGIRMPQAGAFKFVDLELTKDQKNSKDSFDYFDERLDALASIVSGFDQQVQLLTLRAKAAEAEAARYADRCASNERLMSKLKAEQDASAARENHLAQEVARLKGRLEAQRIESALKEEHLQNMLSRERLNLTEERLRVDDAMNDRDDALTELASAYAEAEEVRERLRYAETYMHYLKDQLYGLQQRHQRLLSSAATQETTSEEAGGFSISSIKAAVRTAVRDAAACGDDERKRRLRQLQLRWHPDKNPVLKDFATEVSKAINEAIQALEAGTLTADVS